MAKVKKELETPLKGNLEKDFMLSFKRSKSALALMAERKYRGDLFDFNENKKIVLGYLRKFKPKEWNNIPIPLQDLSV